MVKHIHRVVVALVLTLGIYSAGWAGLNSGEPAPDFTATDSQQRQHTLSHYQGKFVVLEWFNPQCPFVKKHYNTGHMQALQAKYTAQDVVWLTIDSAAEGNQGYLDPAAANQYVQTNNVNVSALVLDASGEVGRLYGALTTPHMFIIDPQGILVYQGAIDDMPSTDAEDIPIAKNYVDETLAAALSGSPVTPFATKSYGCSVKY